MIVWLVSPAYGRPAVTRLALAQWAHLRGGLAERGIELRAVIVADDENLSVAAEHGFDALERPNLLGAKLNDGIAFACERGADWVCFAGSDNWLHPDLFADLPNGERPPIVSGRRIAVVDLATSRMRTIHVRERCGAPPWPIPRWLLKRADFRPAEDERMRGLEGSLLRGLGLVEWEYRDPNPVCRVDFKSDVGITTYASVEHLGVGPEVSAWEALAEHYPAHLIEMAREQELVAA